MKNTIKFFGIIAFAAIIGFSMLACDTGGDASNDDGYLGVEVVLSGKVYEEEYGYGDSPYKAYTGPNLTLSDYGQAGEGSITGGNLKYTIGTPKNPDPIETTIRDVFGYPYSKSYGGNLAASVSAVQSDWLAIYDVFSGWGYELTRVNFSSNNSGYTNEKVFYVYVASDVTVSATGKTETNEYNGDTREFKNISLDLKQGWNAIHKKSSTKWIDDKDDPWSMASTETITWAIKNPALKWVVDTH
ncbi:MAG: hypothetical protein LBH43_19415 [Treponema sp.]|jgi:hypothetical protein|nr:hypothetical protein [Treponema sp.]